MKIAIFVGGGTSFWGGANPEVLKKGIGGREAAAIHHAMNFAEAGNEVDVFAYDQKPSHYNFDSGGRASFLHADMTAPVLSTYPYDVVISWEDQSLFMIPGLDAKLKICAMQVAHAKPVENSLNEKVDFWVALSGWHQTILQNQLPAETQIEIIPNGVDYDLYRNAPSFAKSSVAAYEFLYASSPDRGLIHLLKAWPKIRKHFSDALLRVTYGMNEYFQNAKWSHYLQGEMALQTQELMNQDGVINHGKVGQQQLASIHKQSSGLLYTCDTMLYTETGCCTVIEACAAGNIPFITDCDCLGSEFKDVSIMTPLPWDEDKYIAKLVKTLNSPTKQATLRKKMDKFAQERDWKKISAQYLDLIKERIEEKNAQLSYS